MFSTSTFPALGVTNSIDERELRDIASSSANVYTFETFAQLELRLRSTVTGVCSGVTGGPVTTRRLQG